MENTPGYSESIVARKTGKALLNISDNAHYILS